jgi:hypothetical protein
MGFRIEKDKVENYQNNSGSSYEDPVINVLFFVLIGLFFIVYAVWGEPLPG